MNTSNTLGLSGFYETLATFKRSERRTYVSYEDRRGYLIVKLYKGENELQAHRFNIKRLIGVFSATDPEAARAIARQLKGTS